MFKIVTISKNGFGEVSDEVKTEQNVFDLLVKNNKILPEDLGYVGIPLADNINNRGIRYTQSLINDVQNKFPNFKKIYICQHIKVNELNFYDNTVFTPHVLNSQNHLCIPHYNSVIKQDDYIEPQKRKYKFSFFGAFNSHITRKQLAVYNTDDTPVVDTGTWHYYKSPNDKEKFKKDYVNNLTNTVFSLCPEGTGVSTIRLFESMACGSIPVLFNDVKVPECIREYCIYSKIESLQDDLKNIENKIDEYSKNLYKIYWDRLENEKILEYILDNV